MTLACWAVYVKGVCVSYSRISRGLVVH